MKVGDLTKPINLYRDGVGAVEYVSHMGTDLTVINSARVSFGKHKEELDEKDERLIMYLVKHKHTSTLEHNVVTFRFTVPLFVRSQHHRHRTWSYNEISRRYTDVDIKFYEPDKFRTQHKSNRQASNSSELINPKLFEESDFNNNPTCSEAVKEHHRDCLRFYNNLLKAGVCREQARGVLPQNLYTEYYGTANLNNILKFVDLRTHEGAQWEIQVMTQAVLDIVTELFPITVKAYREVRGMEVISESR